MVRGERLPCGWKHRARRSLARHSLDDAGHIELCVGITERGYPIRRQLRMIERGRQNRLLDLNRRRASDDSKRAPHDDVRNATLHPRERDHLVDVLRNRARESLVQRRSECDRDLRILLREIAFAEHLGDRSEIGLRKRGRIGPAFRRARGSSCAEPRSSMHHRAPSPRGAESCLSNRARHANDEALPALCAHAFPSVASPPPFPRACSTWSSSSSIRFAPIMRRDAWFASLGGGRDRQRDGHSDCSVCGVGNVLAKRHSSKHRSTRRRRWAARVLDGVLALIIGLIVSGAFDVNRPWVKRRVQAYIHSSIGLDVDYASARVELASRRGGRQSRRALERGQSGAVAELCSRPSCIRSLVSIVALRAWSANRAPQSERCQHHRHRR